MKDININIKNGYGIQDLDRPFILERSQKHPHASTNIIYAQNGTMKSSFAKTIHDHTIGADIKDHIFGDAGECHITESGSDISKENILAITSFDTSPFEAANISSLVASEPIKAEYDTLMKKHEAAWRPLITKIRSAARVNRNWKDEDILREIIKQYGETIPIEPRSLMNLFSNTGERDEIEKSPSYIKDIPYTQLDTAQVANFIRDNAGTIQKLVEVYDELRKSPTFYRNGFDASGARKFADAAKASKYFEAEHGLTLKNASTGEPAPVASQEELESALATDIDLVLAKSPTLRKPFEKLIEKFGAGNHGDLRRILEDPATKDIVLIMDNARLFKRRVWQGYLRECQEEADELIRVHKEIEAELKAVIKKAKDEKTKWDEIATQFNYRFHNLPYTVHIDNKDSVIFDNATLPEIVLRYEHPTQKGRYQDFRKEQGQYTGVNHLSTGERKAFYLLNILFELEVRQDSGEEHLVILDDIVDSFDYKNKYAFLEYISEVSEQYTNINLILLTHNFDFFRLLESRLRPITGNHFFIASKANGKINLNPADCFELFRHMRINAHSDEKIWLATLPFVRNLAELKTDDTTDQTTPFMAFTKCLHSLDDEQDVLTIQNLIKAELSTVTTHPFNDNDNIIDVLLRVARSIDDDEFNIYDNIILAMACRRMAEEYMKVKINDAGLVERLKDAGKKGPFTRALYRVYSNNATLDTVENRNKVSEVNLITPEHIHLNAFAYEPLVDIDKSRLIRLRNDIDALYLTIVTV